MVLDAEPRRDLAGLRRPAHAQPGDRNDALRAARAARSRRRRRSRTALIGQQPSPTAAAARMKVVMTIALSATALKNRSRWSFGNGLSRRRAISGSRLGIGEEHQKGRRLRRSTACPGISAVMARCLALSRTITISACCRSLFEGAERAHAHKRRSRLRFDRARQETPMHAMAGNPRKLVQAGELGVDAES